MACPSCHKYWSAIVTRLRKWYRKSTITLLGLIILLYLVFNLPSSPIQSAATVPDQVHISDEIQRDMIARRALVSKHCASGHASTDQIMTRSSYMNRNHSFSLCKVAKTASTFWTRFLYQMAYTNPMQSPYDVEVSLAYAHQKDFRIQTSELDAFQRMTTRVLFVREPFSRLFSAYVDKLLPPNPNFWRAWGVPAILKLRPSVTSIDEGQGQRRHPCGDDTSFPEFVSFAVSKGCEYDSHLMPIYRMCSPCTNNYTVIGKMEAFERDAKHVSSLLGIPESQIRFEKMNDDKVLDAINDSVLEAFSDAWLRTTLKCITREAAAQRVWRKLQIRGFVSWRQRLRLSEEQKGNLKMEELRDMLFEAQALSTNKTELKLQKRQAMIEAYSSLYTDQLSDIIRVYADDFRLFGYSSGLVADLTKNFSPSKTSRAFDWRVDWDLSGL